MTFNPNVNNLIELEAAAELTANFRRIFPNAITANAYGKRDMLSLLAQDDCEGFRIYNGIDDLGAQQLVIVAVDGDGNDLHRGILLDNSQPCPSVCSSANPLNTTT
jgi:hypothetical protein